MLPLSAFRISDAVEVEQFLGHISREALKIEQQEKLMSIETENQKLDQAKMLRIQGECRLYQKAKQAALAEVYCLSTRDP